MIGILDVRILDVRVLDVGIGRIRIEDDRARWPLGTTAPAGALISTTVTLTCACASLERTNTVRATVDRRGTCTSSVVS